MSLLCVSLRCRLRHRHLPACTDGEGCGGCLPRRAADGLRLCVGCTDRLTDDAITAASLHALLRGQLNAAGAPTQRTSGTRDPGLRIREDVIYARAAIAHVLAAWCSLIAEERGIGLPDEHPAAMGGFVARNTTWLAAHHLAGDAADELADLAHGEPFRLAYPTGARRFIVADCPQTTPDSDSDGGRVVLCRGQIWTILRDADALLPSELVCSERPDVHYWTAGQWLVLGRRLRVLT